MTQRQTPTHIARDLARAAKAVGFEVLDEVQIPGQSAQLSPVPGMLDSRVRAWLRHEYPGGLFAHQAKGIVSALKGKDICLSTATASGKSLVFLAVSAHLLHQDDKSRVLALYPAKALIQDQLKKWRQTLRHLGMEPGYIDGGVPVEARVQILAKHRAILMTPDVAHAWLLSHLRSREVAGMLQGLALVVLDEAHVYDGVFGTNMAYFLRRLQAAARQFRFIVSTATVGRPQEFVEKLTGRKPLVFDSKHDKSEIPPKTILLVRSGGGKAFESMVELLQVLAHGDLGRFLAFADSRKMVEQLVSAYGRSLAQKKGEAERTDDQCQEESEVDSTELAQYKILPYRAGYEEEDRLAIQKALEEGALSGVVSTSALELGLDIGDIGIVILLGTPPSVKAFWQRAGRCGRRKPGACLVLDDRGGIGSLPGGLKSYLKKPPEPGWLYLENRFIQFANALAAAVEATDSSENSYRREPFSSLPPQFTRFLENELSPTESVPEELYPLKQRAQAGPHHEFPLRTGIEKNFVVRQRHSPDQPRLGSLTLSQALREAYPGAVYYYMGRPFRVEEFRYRTGEINVRREKRWTTRPQLQNIVFPKFQGGLLQLRRSEVSFLAEAELQVSERVIGFLEQHGAKATAHEYNAASPYSQRPLTRFFETTGVCWFHPDKRLTSEAVAAQILGAFCSLCGVEARDLGFGTFHARPSPLGGEAPCQGPCIYDATHGSLRLTQQLADRFVEVVDRAINIIEDDDAPDADLRGALADLRDAAAQMQSAPQKREVTVPSPSGEWVTVVAPNSRGMYVGTGEPREVLVLAIRYTPDGLMYELDSEDQSVKWMVTSSSVLPINGVTELARLNLFTGEIEKIVRS